ncbi:radical SAM protein [Thermoplasma sp.]|uniref:B12-binding domain-containing radical SAM protein n=1 Tax=Thermoplasma sp. TaxID=1973142 RepID=UPI001284FF2E|nr:radical SAM protein [Thermoplasma sp.]KAA8923149.1 MAG: B12-binding domain-containing radical SAM protein [Thermoplasma sp.]
MSWEVVLTSDRGTFTDYNGSSPLGYVACLPARLVPRFFMDRFFTPPIKAYESGEAVVAPYGLRKVEAILASKGISVVVSPPEHLEKTVDSGTKVLGINVHDPYALSPVSTKLTMIFGGGDSWTAKFFRELGEKVRKLRTRYGFKVIVGGPGAWQVAMDMPDWVDAVLDGEAEIDFPELVRKIEKNEQIPKVTYGRMPKVEEIPTIIKPSRFGEVQITRGCPRGCQFCSITPETFRSIPIEDIVKEVQLNIDHGIRSIELLTDDIMLYGSKKLQVNHEALVNLFTTVKRMGATHIYFPHISAPGAKSSPKTVEAIAEIAEYDKYTAEAPVVGLESGSERIISKYMRGKPFPWTPHDWGDVIVDATGIMVDNHIHPCYTMTIGYPDETDEDIEESIKLVERMIDLDLKAWIFPLPVIPMTASRLKGNEFPWIDTIPKKYWDILYISWKHSIRVTKELFPYLTSEMRNPIVQWVVRNMNERVFSGIEGIFKELGETKGKATEKFAKVEFDNFAGFAKTMYYLAALGFKSRSERKTAFPATN